MLANPAKLVRKILRQLGVEVAYARYCPHGTDQKVFNYYLNGKPVHVIFDVGANIGQTAGAFRASFPTATVYSFEPFRQNFEALEDLAKRDTSIKAFQFALSDSQRVENVLIDSNPFSEWNSLSRERQMGLRNTGVANSEEVRTTRGDEFCKQNGISEIDILKIDTEGHDLEVLIGFKGMLEQGKVACVLVEVGFINDASHGDFQKINSLMSNHSMRLAGFYDISHFENGKCEYANALFVRAES